MKPPKQHISGIKATLMIGVAVFFDGLKVMFALLFLLGPLLAGEIVSESLGGGLVGDTAGVVVAGAGGAAAAGFFLALGSLMAEVVALVAGIVFFIWFLISGVFKAGKARVLGAAAGGALLNVIPFVNAFPWTTGYVAFTVFAVRKSDKKALRRYQAQTLKQRQNEEVTARNAEENQTARSAAANDNEVEALRATA